MQRNMYIVVWTLNDEKANWTESMQNRKKQPKKNKQKSNDIAVTNVIQIKSNAII